MNRKGRNGPSAKRRQLPSRVPVTVRVPADVIRQIDEELDKRDVAVSRNYWFLEAAVEKLRKTSGGSNGAQ